MQRTHTAHERLARVLVGLYLERRVFKLQDFEREPQLVTIRAAVRLDRLADDRLREGNWFEKYRMSGLAEGVARHRVLQAKHTDDIAGRSILDLFEAPRGVGVNVEEFGDVLLDVLTGIKGAHARPHHAGVDADEEAVATRVPRGLEDQGRERFLRVGFALLLLFAL